MLMVVAGALLTAGLTSETLATGAEPDWKSLETSYRGDVVPLLAAYCRDCHSADQAEAEIDLDAFATLADVRRHPQTWQKVGAMLDSGQMPPKDAKQPSETERTKFRDWVRSYLTQEAAARAGDPGPVVLRRLNNAEYTNTVRDLLGLSDLQPTREFPVDGAAGEGFTNTGNALVMSPALVTKYLDAAKELAGHAVLLPDGFAFSAGTTRPDWTNEKLAEIRAFYDQFTSPSEGERVSLQGIVFHTNGGGRLPVEKYLAATIVGREALESGRKSIASVARERNLSAKYLQRLWNELHLPDASLLRKQVQVRWRAAKRAEDAGPITAEIAAWQQGLWRFASVGHIGKVGGPKRWLEPVSPLVTKQELRLKLPADTKEPEIVVSLLTGDAGDGAEHDVVHWRQLRLVSKGKPDILLKDMAELQGLDLRQFGKHPAGGKTEPADLCLPAPSVSVLRIPTAIGAGWELVGTAELDSNAAEGSAQVALALGKVPAPSGLQPAAANTVVGQGAWTGDNRQTSFAAPILVREGSKAQARWEQSFAEFRELFPAAICYTKIVPVDEVVTLTLFYREDDHLCRLLLDDDQQAELDRLWSELRYISQDAVTLVDALAQLIEFATQDADPKVFEPLREPFAARKAAFLQQLVESEPKHLEQLLKFAAQAYRRPLQPTEAKQLRQLYDQLRQQGLAHDEALRLTLARVLVSPAFLYKLEQPPPGTTQGPINDYELASRLSYFLWSSLPDEELLRLAGEGKLHQPEVLLAQARRMLKDTKVRRLATEFGCQWLHIYEFDQHDEKSERHFPTFNALRGPMYEESILFLTDLLQNNGRLREVIRADHSFVNADLAVHYGLPGVHGSQFRRIDGLAAQQRGGILAHSTTLAKQSGASRTSPILRGNWISEVLLGERLPRPPKDVPPLPDEDATTADKSVRELVAAHTRDAKCAVCHLRIDPLGFSLEHYDAIGRFREREVGEREIDTKVTTIDEATFDGLPGLQHYLLVTRRQAFERQFCRKLLGFALGRGVQLSDESLLAEMQANLKANDDRIHAAIETIVLSKQFREIRGRDVADEE
jgi:hypothetical protein